MGNIANNYVYMQLLTLLTEMLASLLVSQRIGIVIFIILRPSRNFGQVFGLFTIQALIFRFFVGLAEVSASFSYFCTYQQLFHLQTLLAEISASLQLLLFMST